MDREERWAGLMRAASAGDEDAYRRLLRDVAGPLRLAARRGLQRAGHSPDEAEDIVQDTLLALHRKRHTWDPRHPFGPWLRGIARHKLMDALRRRKGRTVPLDDLVDALAAPEASGDHVARDVIRLAQHLPSGQKAVLLAMAEGCSGAQAAARLAMTEGAVRVALHRGLTRLAAIVRGTEARE